MYKYAYIYLLSMLLVRAGLLGAALCWAGLATATNPSMMRYCACRVGIEIGMAFVLVCVEALAVTRSTRLSAHKSNIVQSVMWLASFTFSLVGGVVGGAVLAITSSSVIFGLNASVSLMAAVWLVVGSDGVDQPCSSEQVVGCAQYWTKLRSTATDRRLVMPALFTLYYYLLPRMGTCMSYYYTNQLEMDPYQIAWHSTTQQIATAVGMLIYICTGISKMSLRSVMLCGILVGNLIQATQLILLTRYNQVLGIPDFPFVVLDGGARHVWCATFYWCGW